MGVRSEYQYVLVFEVSDAPARRALYIFNDPAMPGLELVAETHIQRRHGGQRMLRRRRRRRSLQEL